MTGKALAAATLLLLASAVSAVPMPLLHRRQARDGQCDTVTDPQRLDCYPEQGASQDACEARGCCWKPYDGNQDNVPWCFYAPAAGYEQSSSSKTSYGMQAKLTLRSPGPFGLDATSLVMDVHEETADTVRIRFTNPDQQRFEVSDAIPDIAASPSSQAADDTLYKVSTTISDFGVAVTREDGSVLFNSTPPESGNVRFDGLVFEDQYISISTQIPQDNGNLYGLGEHSNPLILPQSGDAGQVYTLLAKDEGTPQHNPRGGTELYGSYPFFMYLDSQGRAHGVFLLNSNIMDVQVQTGGAVQFRSTGGIIDLYVFAGPTPADVTRQFTAVVGRSYMPPYWSLGFQLCRWGYDTLQETEDAVRKMREAQIPQDVQWNDIDYMEKYLDFTSDRKRYPIADYGKFVDELHENGQHYVMILDPGISNIQGEGRYKPYDDGSKADIWIKNKQGNPLLGKVWPGLVNYPDFLNSKSAQWWTDQVKDWHDKVAFDGLWIDMNEPSNFCDGECDQSGSNTSTLRSKRYPSRVSATARARGSFDPNDPPYVPGGSSIFEKTAYMDSTQANGLLHYDVHNLYGLSEMRATAAALKTVRGKRSLVISRSTFPSSSIHGGHWLGDNTANWDDLYLSIPGTLMMNMFGVSQVGPDICGFGGDTTEELCLRWMQLGAFYPFSRNHNTQGAKSQEPYALGDHVAEASRRALKERYTLLPYLYTLFERSHQLGDTVARPLFYEFNYEPAAATIDRQFLWGSALMIAPVLEQGASQIQVYFPEAKWYDWYSGSAVNHRGQSASIPVGMFDLPLYVRGGFVLPTQEPALTTTAARKLPFGAVAALGDDSKAVGEAYLDDGESFDAAATRVTFTATEESSCNGQFLSNVTEDNYKGAKQTIWGTIRIFGTACANKDIIIEASGHKTTASSQDGAITMDLSSFKLPLNKEIEVSFSA